MLRYSSTPSTYTDQELNLHIAIVMIGCVQVLAWTVELPTNTVQDSAEYPVLLLALVLVGLKLK